MTMNTLEGLLEHFLRDMYHAEKKLLKTLPKMARKTSSGELRELFESHRDETEDQIERLEKAFESLGLKARAVTCEAIEGIVREGEEILNEVDDPEARDAGMIAAAQAAEHYEIARYGTMIAWARQIGQTEVAELLQQTLDEEYSADRKLSKLAEATLNRKAA